MAGIMLTFRHQILGALALVAIAAPLQAGQKTCIDAYYDAIISDAMTGWQLDTQETIAVSEGVIISRYTPIATARGFSKKVEQASCVSFHCDQLVAVFGDTDHATLLIEWGGTSTQSEERSIIFENASGLSCVVHHAGGKNFKRQRKPALARFWI